MMNVRTMVTTIAAIVAITTVVSAQEHPERERPAKKEEVGVTTKTLAKAITDYVQKEAALKGGAFVVDDPVDKKTLTLSLVKVHKDRLSSLGKGVYFACVDFMTPEGALYDLDFFVKEMDKKLEVTEVTIHKVEGKPRYNWVEKDGVWVKEGL